MISKYMQQIIKQGTRSGFIFDLTATRTTCFKTFTGQDGRKYQFPTWAAAKRFFRERGPAA